MFASNVKAGKLLGSITFLALFGRHCNILVLITGSAVMTLLL